MIELTMTNLWFLTCVLLAAGVSICCTVAFYERRVFELWSDYSAMLNKVVRVLELLSDDKKQVDE